MSLKELTHENHRKAERMNFSRKMVSGDITKEEYSLYLAQMSKVYNSLESLAHELGLVKELHGIDRTERINEDLVELAGEDHNLEFLPSTREYVEYINNLRDDPFVKRKLMAHIYVRHMGDLYGGQIIAQKVPGSGKFYQFDNKEKLIKNLRNYISDDLADEANKAFEFNIKILGSLNHA